MSLLPTPSPTFVARSLSNDVYADLGEGYLLVVLFAFLGLVATHPSILAWKIPCSVVSDSATPWTVAHQAPLSMEILQARILE